MKYVVPQFIDVEDKIMGPLTTRQFVIMLATGLICFIAFKLADFTLFLLISIVFVLFGLILAFFRVNGQPFHFFLLNLIETFKRPGLRLWNKELSDAELNFYVKQAPPPPPPPRRIKEALVATKLAELSLVVNTGGVYNPED